MPLSKNSRLALNLCMLAAGMAMLAYASVPLYRVFCEVTGFGGTTKRAALAPDQATGRIVTLTFNADIAPDLPWRFSPGEPSMQVRVGQNSLTHYVAENLSENPTKGHAVYNVTPHKAGRYFEKIECFCFTEQTLEGRQKVNMPVSFFIDPAFADDPDMKDVHTITLSYTFFAAKEGGS